MPRIMSDKSKDTLRRVERFTSTQTEPFIVKDVRKAVRRDKVTVRNAITKLEKMGKIKPVGKRPTGGRGRPAVVYVAQ